jgi:hypothetical protein
MESLIFQALCYQIFQEYSGLLLELIAGAVSAGVKRPGLIKHAHQWGLVMGLTNLKLPASLQ